MESEKIVVTHWVMRVFSAFLSASRACADFRESTEVSRFKVGLHGSLLPSSCETGGLMKIRVFRAEDTEAVVQLWQQVGLTRPWNDPRKDISRKLKVQPELFLVAVEDDDVSLRGTIMAGYDGHRGWLNYMAVSPQSKGLGIGRRLFDEVRQTLLVMGCCKINLQVRTDNLEAQGFYRALGFNDDACVSMGLRLVDD